MAEVNRCPQLDDIANLLTFEAGTFGVIGYGAMGLTFNSAPPSEEKAFAVLKTAIDLGCNLINSAEFYGLPDNRYAGIELLGRFYTNYPEYIDKTVLVCKGGMAKTMAPALDMESLRRSVSNINNKISPKRMDIFVPARFDTSRPIEEVMKNLAILRDEGHYKHIGLSEIKGTTLEAANKIARVVLAEVEYSVWMREIEENGVLDVCKANDIVVLAYSPLGAGILSGSITKGQRFTPMERLSHLDRYQPENLDHNLQLVDELKTIANKKGVSLVQLSLAWLRAQYKGVVPIPGSTRVEGVKEAASAAAIHLTSEELLQIKRVLDNFEVKGGRYNAHFRRYLSQ